MRRIVLCAILMLFLSGLVFGQGLSMRVYVWGKVLRPGMYELGVGSRVLDALCIAGGVSSYGDISRVRVVRREEGGYTVVKVDLKDVLAGKGEDIFLKDGDVVVVPRSLWSYWREAISLASDIAVLITLYINVSSRLGG